MKIPIIGICGAAVFAGGVQTLISVFAIYALVFDFLFERWNHMKLRQAECPISEDKLLYMSIKNAHSELEQAVGMFNELTDNKAVDYASYNLLAARAKYSYLLQLAKSKNLSL